MKEGEADEIGENNTITAAFLISYENGSVLYNTMPKRIATAYRITNIWNKSIECMIIDSDSISRPGPRLVEAAKSLKEFAYGK